MNDDIAIAAGRGNVNVKDQPNGFSFFFSPYADERASQI
jgi:hypothetical protein